MKENGKWLEHLEEAVPTEGYGNRLSMYLIALEAWRRGITVTFFTVDNPENKILIRYSLKLNDKEHKFVSSRGDKLTDEAFDICDNKDLTKQYLEKAGVKVPKGKRFEEAAETYQDILEYGVSLGFPVVLKPVNENAGKGVFSNINSKEELVNTLDYLIETLHYTDLIIEEFIPGTEYRVLTVGEKIAAAVNRIPANIVGDGEKTIEDLIKEKNKLKRANPNLSKKTIQMDKEIIESIEKADYTIDSILEEDEQLFLRSKSNISTGGDPIDVTDQLTEEQINVVRKTIQAIPGLTTSGMDLMIDPDDQSPTVIEVNTKPMLGLHTYPMEGEAYDVVKDIVDYYFPETINQEKSNLYFDFEKILSPLDNLSAKTVELVPPKSLDTIYSKKFTLNGEAFNDRFRNQIRLEAMKLELHGHTRKLDDENLEILVGSENTEAIDHFISECKKLSEKVVITQISEVPWNKPICIGFRKLQKTRREWKEITNKLNADIRNLEKTNKKIKTERKSLKRENKTLNEYIKKIEGKYNKERKQRKDLREKYEDILTENQKLKQELKEIKNSRSWQITKPLRKATSIIKK